MNKLGKRVLTGLLTVPVALSMPISVSAYALEDGSDEILVAAAESAEIVYDAVAVADDAAEATDAADSTDVVADVMAAVENSEAGVVAMAADVPVAVAEDRATEVAKILAPLGDSYDETKVKVEGDTITFLSNVTISKEATVDTTGITINTGAYYLAVTNKVTFTGNGTVQGSGTAVILPSGAASIVTIDGVTIINTAKVGVQAQSSSTVVFKSGLVKGVTAGIKAITGANITMSGGEIQSSQDGIYVSTKNGLKNEVNIAGGKITTTSAYGIAILGPDSINGGGETEVNISGAEIYGELCALTVQGTAYNTTLNIEDSKLSSTGNTALYLAGDADVVISDSEISGYAGIVVRGGTLEISGETTVTATGSEKMSTGDSKTLVPAGAIVADNISGYQYKKVTISDGTFNGSVLYMDSRTDENNRINGTSDTFVVDGGSFSESLIGYNYLDESLAAELESSEDGMFSYYASIEDALNEAADGDVITDVVSFESASETVLVKIKSGYDETTIKINVKSGATVTLPENEYFEHPEGMKFLGWSVDDGDTLEAGAEANLSEGMTLVAQWGVNKEALEELVKQADAINPNNSIPSTANPFKDALKEAHSVLDDDEATQAQVNDALAKLAEAKAGLVQRANKGSLNNAINAANELNEDDYTAGSWAEFQDALARAKAAQQNPETVQAEANEVLSALREAMENLVDISDLKEAVAGAEGVKTNDFTPSTVGSFKDALAEAKSVLENEDATQEEVDDALANLTEAKDNLVRRANKSSIIKSIKEADELDEEAYTPNSWAESGIEEALEHARAVKDNPESTQEEVNEANAALRDAIDALVERADFSELEEAVNSALEAITKAEETGDYTDESVAALLEALLNALENINENSSQEDVDAATQAILDAIVGLEKVEQPIELPSVPKTNDDIVNWVFMMATSVSVLTMLGYGAIAAKAKAKASKK